MFNIIIVIISQKSATALSRDLMIRKWLHKRSNASSVRKAHTLMKKADMYKGIIKGIRGKTPARRMELWKGNSFTCEPRLMRHVTQKQKSCRKKCVHKHNAGMAKNGYVESGMTVNPKVYDSKIIKATVIFN